MSQLAVKTVPAAPAFRETVKEDRRFQVETESVCSPGALPRRRRVIRPATGQRPLPRSESVAGTSRGGSRIPFDAGGKGAPDAEHRSGDSTSQRSEEHTSELQSLR